MKTACIIVSLLFLTSCNMPGREDIFTDVSLKAILPDGRNAVLITVDGDENVSFFRNINTRENYPYPRFTNCMASMKVQKGVYILGFDGTADFGDDTVRRVRCSRHRQPSDAVNLMNSDEILTLELTYLN